MCSPFTRAGARQSRTRPTTSSTTWARIETDGFDFKVDWRGNELSWGRLSAGLQATYVNDYTATDTDGIVSQRAVGIEVSDSAIPKMQANLQLGWEKGDWGVSFDHALHRLGGRVLRQCADHQRAGLRPRQVFHTLDSTIYNDVQVAWNKAFGDEKLQAGAGRQQHLRRGSADLLHLLTQWLRRGYL